MAWLRGQPDAGLRWGEIRALRVRRLDLLRARLEVAENVPDGCDESETVTPKSHKRRVVPLPRFLIDALAQQVAGRRPDELVCANGAGGLLDNSNFRRNVFDPAVRAMGVGPFTPHNLRDTAASLAVSVGANVKAIQRMLGHASAAHNTRRLQWPVHRRPGPGRRAPQRRCARRSGG